MFLRFEIVGRYIEVGTGRMRDDEDEVDITSTPLGFTLPTEETSETAQTGQPGRTLEP